MLYALAILSFIWIVSLTGTLYVLSQVVSLLGIYHVLDKNGGNECFLKKLWELMKCNAALSLPLLFTFNYLFQTTLIAPNVQNAFYLSLPITILTLLSIRIIANPTDITQPSTARFFSPEKRNSVIEQHKERILSFFYSFISASIILLILIFSYHAFTNQSFNELQIPSLSISEFAEAFAAYLTFLFLGTLFGEIILKIKPPINTIL
jgi:hypothetical protein